MSFRRRMALPLAGIGTLGVIGVLLLTQSHAAANPPMNFTHLNKIQKRLVSGALASALGDEGSGPDGLPFDPPASYASASVTGGSPENYSPNSAGKCSSTKGSNVKVNQNCLNIADPSLQGRSQANNEASIAADPFAPSHLVASDNNYIRGDGTCGAHFSTNGGSTWSDATTPNGFTNGPSGFAREYWQAGGDTSVAWDTEGNSYLSCQVFNRGNAASPNPDQSSGFILFRSTGNNGASFNFPGRYMRVFFDTAGNGTVLEDKQLISVDDNPGSHFRDRIYVSWTEFAADGTAYIYEAHSNDYGESFSRPVVVSANSPLCTNNFGIATPHGNCNENQFSQPFVGPNGVLYVTYANFNNSVSGNDNRNQMLLARSTDGGNTFSAPVKVSDYYDLPDCDTYQGAGADSFRACVPEKGKSTKSVFRATNYPSGAVNPTNSKQVVVTFGSYINKDSNESNGCAPDGFASDGINKYTGVKQAGACNNKILVSVSNDGGKTFSGGSQDPRIEAMVTQAPGQNGKDQFWQWEAYNSDGKLAVDYYDRQYGNDEVNGSSDFSLSGSSGLASFGQVRVTSSSMPAPTQFEGPNGGQFYGDYIGLATAGTSAHPIWSDTRYKDLFLCPGSGAPAHPPALCGGTEANGQAANDEETETATVGIPGS